MAPPLVVTATVITEVPKGLGTVAANAPSGPAVTVITEVAPPVSVAVEAMSTVARGWWCR